MQHLDFLTSLVRFETDLWNAVELRLHADGERSLAIIHTLQVVHENPAGCRVQDVADEIGITTGAASKLVDRLEAAGLLTRVANPDDRRSSLLAMTAAGSEAHGRGASAVDRHVRELIGDTDEPASLTPRLRALRSAMAAR